MNVEIQSAKIIRTSSHDGQLYAEVEVELVGFDKPFTVRLEKNQEQFNLSQILQNDEDHAIDWYDNDLHQAYFDMKDQLFHSDDHSNPDNEMVFVNQLLEFEGLKSEINKQ